MKKIDIIELYIKDLESKVRASPARDSRIQMLKEELDQSLPVDSVIVSLAIGTKILSNGEECIITDNTNTFNGETAYRLDGDMHSLWLRQDFDYVIANET
ncbi:MAG: hypothetical protein COA36_16900 [Desulfotalea sp.]|nr:MAG: hypothetical protein COA36_16900 [Desulfotalea sp.]